MRSHRLDQLPPYLFVEIDRLRESYRASGREVLDLGIGDPDCGAPPELIELLGRALARPEHHRYPPGRGHGKLLAAIRGWAHRRYGVALRDEELLVTIGSKEAIGHLPLAIADPGEAVLVPDPGYPVYHAAAVFAGAEPVRVPLRAANQYWPDFTTIDESTARRAALLYLNYPNNPTAAVADRERFAEAISWCRSRGVVLANDAAYNEITFESPSEPLFPLARESDAPYIELFSFSKTFSVTGWRVGFAVGSPAVIAALAAVKQNIDSGVFGALQEAIAGALEGHYEEIMTRTISRYRERRDELAASLGRSAFSFALPAATFYFWVGTPAGADSVAFCRSLLEETGIVAAPGVGFGAGGEGYFRLSITTGIETIRESGRRLEAFSSRTRAW